MNGSPEGLTPTSDKIISSPSAKNIRFSPSI